MTIFRILLTLIFLITINKNILGNEKSKNTLSSSVFSNLQCLDLNFELKKEFHWERFFLWKSHIELIKDECQLHMKIEKWPFFSEEYHVDVCREPVHFKKGEASESVVMRTDENFSKEYYNLESILVDRILVHAEGEKENLYKEHGKVYCSFLLMYNYLAKGIVFSRFINNIIPEGMISSRAKEIRDTSIPLKKIDEMKEKLNSMGEEKKAVLEREEQLKKKIKTLEDSKKTSSAMIKRSN